MGRLLLCDTKQMLDWDGTLGYASPGLQNEALSLPPLRGHGVAHWLPWLGVAQLEPLLRLRDVFGSFDIERSRNCRKRNVSGGIPNSPKRAVFRACRPVLDFSRPFGYNYA